jgi:hypothetical protein
MLKLADNPPPRPPSVATIAALDGDWWVAHTKARFEKALAWNLLEWGIPYFLPMIPRVHVSNGRRFTSQAPLFPSYVFFCGTDSERYRAFTTNRICRVIPVHDRKQFVEELATIEMALTNGGPALQFYPYAAVGKRCRVARGPFRGLEGTVVQANGVAQVVLHVSILGQGASFETSVESLEPLD